MYAVANKTHNIMNFLQNKSKNVLGFVKKLSKSKAFF